VLNARGARNFKTHHPKPCKCIILKARTVPNIRCTIQVVDFLKINQRNNASGFSLVETLVVLAMVSALILIAGANWERFTARSRNSEAKLALTAVYVGERSFYNQYQAYVQGMKDIAYIPTGLKRFYTVGWTAASNYGAVVGYYSDGALTTPSIPSYARVNFPAGYNNCTLATLGTDPGAATTTGLTFKVVATGQIRSNATACDTWTMDHNKTMINTTVGF
jgi:type IV pilus assembly protein PilA